MIGVRNEENDKINSGSNFINLCDDCTVIFCVFGFRRYNGSDRFSHKKSDKANGVCDIDGDGDCDVFDVIKLRRNVLYENNSVNTVYVRTSGELTQALNNALPGDEIVLEAGIYTSDSTGPKGANFWSAADGTRERPITIRSSDTENQALLYGKA